MTSSIRNLPSLFLDKPTESLNKVAIVTADKSFTFLELLSAALDWSLLLKDMGLGISSRIALFSDKSFDYYASIIACNLEGILYTSLDDEVPSERLDSMLGSFKPDVILDFQAGRITTHDKVHILPTKKTKINEIGDIYTWLREKSHEIPEFIPAYVMYTSGSTGIPKGVVIAQNSIYNFILWSRHEYGINSDDVFSGINQSHFDNSIFDLYCSLYNFASLVPVPRKELLFPKKVVQRLENAKVTVWFSVPSYLIFSMKMKSLKEGVLTSIRLFIFGGEGFPKQQLKKLYYMFHEQAKFFNVYGPTETTCICSSYLITDFDFKNEATKLCPLGILAPNYEYEISAPDEETGIGELILYGPQTALGYLNEPNKTTENFLFFNQKHGYIRLGYKTGDLVSLDNTGLLRFHGRVDFQIKHMGYRIELEEVENAFQNTQYFDEAVATYQKTVEGTGLIVLHYANNEITLKDDFLELELKKLSASLPKYMRPNKYIRHLELPKNNNGKIDRKKLYERS